MKDTNQIQVKPRIFVCECRLSTSASQRLSDCHTKHGAVGAVRRPVVLWSDARIELLKRKRRASVTSGHVTAVEKRTLTYGFAARFRNCSFGSRASGIPSPMKLSDVTASVMAAPGMIASQGAPVRWLGALRAYCPRSVVDGRMRPSARAINYGPYARDFGQGRSTRPARKR